MGKSPANSKKKARADKNKNSEEKTNEQEMDLAGQQLQAVRSSLRKQTKETMEEVQSQLQKPTKQQDVGNLEGLKQILDNAQGKLNEYNAQVIGSMTVASEVEAEADECFKWDSEVHITVCKLQVAINRCYKAADEEETDRRSITSNCNGKLYAKLPKLDIPKFDGNYMQWQAFWDSFEAAIGNNAELTNGQKMQYLLSYLTGDAKKNVEGFRLVDANYEPVVSLLKERYGDDEIAICMHFERLFAMPQGDQTNASLKEIYNTCELHIRSLISLNLDEETFGRVFVPLILSKIPKEIRVQLHRNNEGKPYKLPELRAKLKDEIKFREMSETYVSGTTQRGQQGSSSSNRSQYESRYQSQSYRQQMFSPGAGRAPPSEKRNSSRNKVHIGSEQTTR
jgi:hypothetical protein